jgi:ribulose-5-phosphate 4-epimerase/fuculose-1-phosphate aldolase
VVPVIANTEREAELTERLKAAIAQYPRTYAILVENHGVYIWGDSWVRFFATSPLFATRDLESSIEAEALA